MAVRVLTENLPYVPRLETEKLVLRGRTLDDFPASKKMWADEDFTRYADGKPLNEEQSWQKFLRTVGSWALLGYGYWIVEEKETGAFVGDVGCGEYHRSISPAIKGMPEIGWGIDPAHQGKGYGYEAAQAAFGWMRSRFPDLDLCCIIDPANAPSIRIAERLGFAFSYRADYHDAPIDIFVFRPTSS
ncbi:MAG: GNAT family N-acetyltransferase [Pseudomonadota bacterium]